MHTSISAQTTLLIASLCIHGSFSFVLPQAHKAFSVGRGTQVDQNHDMQISMAGMGMGMATKSKKKSSKKGKKKGSGPSFDVSKSMLKSEKLYDELLKEANKIQNNEDHKDHGHFTTNEYVIAARINPDVKADSIPGASSVSDWVPVAQLCLTKPFEDERHDETAMKRQRLSSAISLYCREISYVASLGSSIFKSIPRNFIQYSVEDIDSFHKYVYEDVIEGKNADAKNDSVMTKVEAREVLKLADDCNDLSEIKQAYRKLSMKLHPDRFVGVERTEEEVEKSNDDFSKVKIAYESLQSGVRTNGSWYESLGGRSRTDFVGSLEMLSMDKAKAELEKRHYKCAIAGLTQETVMAFVTRNQLAA
jgi:hypothetical protein